MADNFEISVVIFSNSVPQFPSPEASTLRNLISIFVVCDFTLLSHIPVYVKKKITLFLPFLFYTNICFI